eukprot:TRINITY_DN26956_c0_g1_i1.p1 TRINITY_DN26956_c0_g1~~TRINITY_DN26956_c0_g1_i1.p1  ORF type:complete len:159 (-),score=24.71 TRINITY_DN26956_c0_g1_i1:369-845(-)
MKVWHFTATSRIFEMIALYQWAKAGQFSGQERSFSSIQRHQLQELDSLAESSAAPCPNIRERTTCYATAPRAMPSGESSLFLFILLPIVLLGYITAAAKGLTPHLQKIHPGMTTSMAPPIQGHQPLSRTSGSFSHAFADEAARGVDMGALEPGYIPWH